MCQLFINIAEMKLFLVPTPIGNLGDMTYRGVEVLQSVDEILAEDTRTSAILLKHFQITTPMYSFHQHNEHDKVDQIISRLREGKMIALITDAGTPGISDPGFLLVRACIENAIDIECLPGATAFVPALVVSGFPIHEFTFLGFAPIKKGRQTFFEKIKNENKTVVLYESPHRIQKTLEKLREVLGNERKVCICRELSKRFEEKSRMRLGDISNYTDEKTMKGEFVIVIDRA